MGRIARCDTYRQGLRRWLDRLLPPTCVVCGDPLSGGAGHVCAACWARAPRPRHPRCTRCDISLRDIGLLLATSVATSGCRECADWWPYLQAARAPFVMAGTAAEIVYALKFGGWQGVAEAMAEAMAVERLPRRVEAEATAVLAVPLSRVRLRERGFNQAELLARGVSARRGWRLLAGVLERVRHTRQQARLAPGARSRNVAGAFRITPEGAGAVRDAHLILVDDVLTTGATALACVRALVSAGARGVSVLTFARARPDLRS